MNTTCDQKGRKGSLATSWKLDSHHFFVVLITCIYQIIQPYLRSHALGHLKEPSTLPNPAGLLGSKTDVQCRRSDRIPSSKGNKYINN